MMILSFLGVPEQDVANLLSKPLLFSLPPLFFLLIYIIKWLLTPPATSKNLPPSPPKLPLIGNFHQLGMLPHRSLQSLAQRHGPLMLIQLGSVPITVLSSIDVVRQVTKTHDLSFPNKPDLKNSRKLLYNMKDLSQSPYGEYWRQLKSMFVLQLLSNRRVHSFCALREEEIDFMMNKIQQLSSSSLTVDLSDMFPTLAAEVVCRAAFGRKYNTNENRGRLKELLGEFMDLLGTLTFGDFIPWLAWVDHISGLNHRVNRVAKELDEFLEGVIEDRMAELETRGVGQVQEAFIDILLRIQKDDSTEFSFDRDNIKGLLLDVYAAGADTTAAVLEWAMAELLGHPKVMKKLQRDVREILDGKQVISEAEIHKMQYLKAVIKETLRLHPPVALQGRSVAKDVKVMGYEIASGTMVFVNAWCIGRDVMYWDEPEEFRPERFLNSSLDFKGHDLQFIPFGFGRRGCPGISFAMATIEFALANLMHKFDWELPKGVKADDLDMTECPGLTARRSISLKAVATPIPC